jgi:GNAT superfamily N-acetyltransferase
MHQLAIFEGYADRFSVTEQALLERGFAIDHKPEFAAIVAADNDLLVGYAVTYIVPFTFDLRPTLILKELFVSESVRGSGIGRSLLAAVLEQARGIGARLLRWQVLPNNEPAMRLYRSIGAGNDTAWQHWVLEL